MTSRKIALRLALTLLVVAIAMPALAQSAGSLRGTVKDETGSVVPGATVVLTSETTKFKRQTVSDATGGFFFASVDPGTYTVDATLQGFKAWKATGLRVSANDTLAIEVKLSLGELVDVVTVEAERDMIVTDTGAREGLITPEQLESISIVGRNPTELLRILPGVVSPRQSAFEENGITSGFGAVGDAFSINGARGESLGITLDGANLRDVGNNSGMLNVPNNEFVAEVKVQTSNYAAEFGSAAVTVQAVTKSGSSEFHGSLFDYVRHYSLAANDRSRNYANPDRTDDNLGRPKSKFQYPGATLSGPLTPSRDRAFFFVGFEIQKQELDVGTNLGVTATPGMREGLFNDFLGGQRLNWEEQVLIPGGYPGAGAPAPNNDLRPYITPQGQALLNLWPDPNLNDPNNRYNYIVNRLGNADRKQGVVRLDLNVTESTRAYVRLAQDTDAPEFYRGLWWQPSSVELPSPLVQERKGQSAVLNVTSVLSPTATNEFIFSWSRLLNDNLWQDPAAMQKATYGITDLDNPFGSSPWIPDMNSGNNSGLWFAQDVEDIFAYNGFIRFADSVTKVMNTHAIKVGAVVERQYKEQNFQHQANIQYDFSNWGAGTTRNDLADVLVGRPSQATVGEPSAIGHFVSWNIEAFAQDSWKVSPNLTLEYGLRFGKWTTNTETNQLGAIFLPELYDSSQGVYVGEGADRRINGVAYAARGEVPDALTDSRPLLWMPRANFAWDLQGDGKTIVRGGAGIFFMREQGNAQYDIINIPPNSYSAQFNSWDYASSFGGQGLTYSTTAQIDPFGRLSAPDIATPNPTDIVWPRTYNASISVARRLPGRQTLEVGYVGTFGRNIVARTEQNFAMPGAMNASIPNYLERAALTGTEYNSRFRPYAALNAVRYPVYIGEYNYHALQATLSRQTGAFQYLVAYTYSQNKGTVSGNYQDLDPIDTRNRAYGVLNVDRPHVLNVSWTWRLGQPFESGIAKFLLNDWNLSGISTYSSGPPYRPFFSGDLGGDQAESMWWGTRDYLGGNSGGQSLPGGISPMYTCDPNKGGSAVDDRIWDVNCIGIPAFGETGPTYPPNTLRAPSQSFHDLTVFKDFPMGGARKLQIRAGAFNIFNQAYPETIAFQDVDAQLNTNCNVRVDGVPDGAGGTATVCDGMAGYQLTSQSQENFGRIITKRGHRVIELAVKFMF